MGSSHFKGLDPLAHLKEKRKETSALRHEVHGTAISHSLAHFIDSIREGGMLFLLLFALASALAEPAGRMLLLFSLFAAAWVLWRTCRTAILGWSQLERLHRLIEQERYEIEHHTSEEREELEAIYHAKGLRGELLTRVVDAFMADPDRLLKIMLEEEMGLTLAVYEHPLKQSIGAFLGAALCSLIALGAYSLSCCFAGEIAAFILFVSSLMVSAHFEKNRLIPALIWGLAIAVLCYGTLRFLLERFVI